ncbi:methyltransferase domain-containing protein [Ruegeria sp. 2205SS24-7]|uniref:class I SAM-dependent methyltransferase n=1 Tax=Ruegeria discodermiae TaxID=3064389 RepID=UPI0027425BC2|nr:class I SAM-dependent methyltransferase [Ruegeria sp. 2205SS24-7]MDP5216132.1 methyltransferase domain-containing protein [Ruegeria sp. 2205SS24-7]
MNGDTTDSPNAEQQEYWSATPSGRKWLTYEDHLDAAMAPILDLVVQRAKLQPGERVIDIGCGTGASLLAAAERVGPTGDVLGLDIAEPFLERAAARAAQAGLANVSVRQGDAQVASFDGPPRDVLISRFGMMFFADPQAAFANLSRALRPGGRMCFAAWGGFSSNPWFRLPFEAAADRLGTPPPADPDAPGPMGFQNAERVTGLMRAAGLQDVRCDSVDVLMTPMGRVEDVATQCLRVGPAARLMRFFEGNQEDAAEIEQDITRRLHEMITSDGLRIPAQINLFEARV